MTETAKTTLYLPEDLHCEIKIEAAKQRIPMTKLVVRALERELELSREGDANTKGQHE